jgi:hypothetical protein
MLKNNLVRAAVRNLAAANRQDAGATNLIFRRKFWRRLNQHMMDVYAKNVSKASPKTQRNFYRRYLIVFHYFCQLKNKVSWPSG